MGTGGRRCSGGDAPCSRRRARVWPLRRRGASASSCAVRVRRAVGRARRPPPARRLVAWRPRSRRADRRRRRWPPGPGADVFAAELLRLPRRRRRGRLRRRRSPPRRLRQPRGADGRAGRHPDAVVRRRSSATRRSRRVARVRRRSSIADPAARTADAADGGEIYRLYCAGCHSATGRGGALTRGRNAPDICAVPGGRGARRHDPRPRQHAGLRRQHPRRAPADRRSALYVDVLVRPAVAGRPGLGYLGPGARGRRRRPSRC